MNVETRPIFAAPVAAESDVATLAAAARERILVLDGAMGTQIQELQLRRSASSAASASRSASRPGGNNDLLTLTQPEAIDDIHFAYSMAGADIVETNTFSSTAIAQADYGMRGVCL